MKLIPCLFFLFFIRGYKPKIQTHVARTTANNKNCMALSHDVMELKYCLLYSHDQPAFAYLIIF